MLASYGSVIRSCVFDLTFAQPIRILASGVVVDRNVITGSVMSAIQVAEPRSYVTNNLVLGAHCFDYCAGCCGKWNVFAGAFEVNAGVVDKDGRVVKEGADVGMTFTGNVAAGGPIGFKFNTAPPEIFHDNVVHGAQIGIAVNGGCAGRPVRLRDTLVYRAWDFAVWGHTAPSCNVFEFDNLVLVDSKVSMVWGAVGPDSAKHLIGDQKIFLRESLLVGQSHGNSGNCDNVGSTSLAFSWPASKPQTALMLPVFVTAYLEWPGWGDYGEAYSEITYANFIAGSYPQLFGEVHVESTTILRYGLDAGCANGRQSHVLENIPAAADANYPQFYSNITIDASSRLNISHFTPPKREWITIDDCVAMDCDGPKHVLIHDLDGTLLGRGSNATLTSKAEFMNRWRMDNKQTVYSIPTKMLYDPAPLNIPDDPGHSVQDPGYQISDGKGGGHDGRRLQMVWFEGDERALYPIGEDGTSCDRDWAKFDPACGAVRRTHAETAYRAYGTYREGCEMENSGTGWICTASEAQLARLVVESMDGDTETRVLVPVALASGGYVDLLNGGQDRSWAFGYSALKRLSTFFPTVGLDRGYDLTFTASNPRSVRLILPSSPRSERVVISIFYSNPERLEVRNGAMRSARCPFRGAVHRRHCCAVCAAGA